MSKSRFATVRSLFGGTALSSPREDDEHEDGPAASDDAPKQPAGPTVAQVDAAVATEVAGATKAANDRWNTVMTSDAGIANPKAAARLLNSTTMSAEDVAATLGDLAPAAAKPVKDTTAADRAALAGDPAADPDTGGAGGNAADRRGEGEKAGAASLKERREARAMQRNKAALAAGGKQVDA